MTVDRLQRQRLELKFRLAPDLAGPIRYFLRCHLEPDPFGRGAADGAYDVRSVYLDSDDLALCQSTLNGDKNRYKLRLRYYENGPQAPAFLELKRRDNDSIHKSRALLRPGAAAALLQGEGPSTRHLAAPDARSLEALQSIWALVHRLDAAPRALVVYRREAWVNPHGNDVRVTFDRDVTCIRWTSTLPGVPPASAAPVFDGDVILEVKFTDRFPRWVGQLVSAFDLVRGSAAKYVDGITRGTAGSPAVSRFENHLHDRRFSAW